MKQKTLGTLLVLTAATLAAAGFAVHARKTSRAASDERGLFLPELEGRLNDVTELFIDDGKDQTTVVKEGDEWFVSERGRYPAKFEAIKETLMSLSRLEVEEAKTSDPERYVDLGVEDPGSEDADSKRLVVKDAGGNVLADVVVGDLKWRSSGSSVYVRRADEARAFLCRGRLPSSLQAAAKGWVEREVVKVNTQDLADVRLVHADGEEILLERMAPDSSQFLVANRPEEREERYRGVANGIASNLASLTLDDVWPASEVDFGSEPLATVEYAKKDGQVIVVEAARYDDRNWIRISSLYREPEPALVDTVPAEPGAEPGDEPEEAAGPDPEEVRRAVAELNERLAPWAYQIPAYKFENLTKRMEDLLAEVEDEAEIDVDALDPDLDSGDADMSEEQALQLLEDVLDQDAGKDAPGDDGHEGHDHGDADAGGADDDR